MLLLLASDDCAVAVVAVVTVFGGNSFLLFSVIVAVAVSFGIVHASSTVREMVPVN